MEKLKAFSNETPGRRILDIGTGSGGFVHLLSYLSSNYDQIIGIDTNSRAIEAANKNFDDEKISFLEMDVRQMTFDYHSFDLVCISNSLHHLEDVSGTIELMKKMVKPDGYLLFNEMYSDVDDPKRKTHVLMHHFWGEIDTENGIEHRRTYERQEILDLLSSNGCIISESWDMVHEDEHELTDKDYEYLNNVLDQYLSRVKNEDKRDYYNDKAEVLRARMKDVGFSSATQLLTLVK